MIKTLKVGSGISGSLTVPPDKSIAHRAAMFAAIADGVSHIENYPQAADPQTTLKVITGLGIRVDREGSSVVIHGRGRYGLTPPSQALDCENSGTTMRLMTGILTGANIPCTLIGDASLSKRPMKRIMGPLASMGGKLSAREDTYPPLALHAHQGLSGMDYTLPIASAQLKSCLLLAGLYCEQAVRITEPVRSRDHTERMLGFSVYTDAQGHRVIESSKQHALPLQNFAIPGDFSSAAFWMVAGSIMQHGSITLTNVGLNPTRDATLHILKRMGANIQILSSYQAGSETVADILIQPARLQATTLTESEVAIAIDELPVLSLAMAFADGISEVRGAEELRVKECDRIDAVVDLLRLMQIEVEAFRDGFHITGKPDHTFSSIHFDSRHDHRIAMMAAIAALRSHGEVTIEGAEHASVSYPSFWSDYESLQQG